MFYAKNVPTWERAPRVVLEIGARLGEPDGAVKSRLHCARARVREHLLA